MAPPSNPHLMAKVLEAVKQLGEGRGSSARQVLEIVKQGNKTPPRNLAMQVQRALKNAVTAGLLKLRSGRYKMLISLQNTRNNRSGNANGNKTGTTKSSGQKKEDPESATDSGSLQPAEAGPKSRCSHCKKHKRRASRRRRKRSTKGRRRPTKQAAERKSRRLRRRGEDEVSNRRGGRGKAAVPGARSQSKVPERPGKTNPETSQDEDQDMRESGSRRDESESSSDTEGEEEGPDVTRASLSGAGREKVASSQRSSSKPRRSSRKRNSVHKMGEVDSEEAAMECCDEDEHRGQELAEEDANASEHNAGSGTSI